MDTAVRSALVAGARTWSFRWERISSSGETGPLRVSAAKVANNDLATGVKRTAELTLAPGTVLDPLDKIRGYARLKLADGSWYEWPVGTFYPETGVSAWSDKRSGPVEVTGYDTLLVLTQDAVLTRYVVSAGTNYRDAVVSVLASSGLDGSQISSTQLTLPTDMEWPPGTTKLTIINALLGACGFRSLIADELGAPTSQPYLDPSQAPVVWSYAMDRESVIVPGVDVELDLFDVPNAWIAVVSEPERELVSSFINDDPNSQLSTVSRGRTIVQVIDNPEAATQEILDDLVHRAAEEASQVWEIAEFETGLMPFHGSGDVCLLDYGEGPKRFREHEWEMELKVGGRMTHRFRRVASI